MEKLWFKEWFNTPYYHTLYKNRNNKEAQNFIDKLYNYLNLKNEYCLDLACGKGRHSNYLNSLGLKVLGLDLSEESINSAKKYNNANLKFDTHDMREVYRKEQFNIVFNLFTSFGYFDDSSDNLKVLEAVKSMLLENGRLVIDFMNAQKVTDNLVNEEIKVVDGIEFKIKRNYDGKHIFKNIKFSDNGQDFDFTERVQALTFPDFKEILEKTGFEIEQVFGNFDLDKFDSKSSDRLIIIAKL